MEPFDSDLREAWLRATERMERQEDHLPYAALESCLNGVDDPGTEIHLAACGACRSALVALSRSCRRGGLQPGLAWRWAAAAALLVSAGVLWRASRTGDPPLPPSGLTFAPRDGVEENVLGASVKICAAPGSAWSRTGDGTLLLERGTLLLETFGERVLLRLPGLVVESVEGVLAAEIQAPAGASAWTGLVSEALASGSPEGRLTLLSGHALVRPDGAPDSVKISPGDSVRADDGRLLPCAPVLWRGPSWTYPARDSGEIFNALEILLPHPPPSPEGGYVLEVQVRKRSQQAALGILLPTEGRGHLVALGANLLGVGQEWTLLRTSCTGGRILVTAGEQVVLDLSEHDLGTRLPAEAVEGAGLKAWGGEIEFRRVRWRTLP